MHSFSLLARIMKLSCNVIVKFTMDADWFGMFSWRKLGTK